MSIDNRQTARYKRVFIERFQNTLTQFWVWPIIFFTFQCKAVSFLDKVTLTSRNQGSKQIVQLLKRRYITRKHFIRWCFIRCVLKQELNKGEHVSLTVHRNKHIYCLCTSHVVRSCAPIKSSLIPFNIWNSESFPFSGVLFVSTTQKGPCYVWTRLASCVAKQLKAIGLVHCCILGNKI